MLQIVSPGQIVPKAESVRLALVQLYAPIPGRASVESRRNGNNSYATFFPLSDSHASLQFPGSLFFYGKGSLQRLRYCLTLLQR